MYTIQHYDVYSLFDYDDGGDEQPLKFMNIFLFTRSIFDYYYGIAFTRSCYKHSNIQPLHCIQNVIVSLVIANAMKTCNFWCAISFVTYKSTHTDTSTNVLRAQMKRKTLIKNMK